MCRPCGSKGKSDALSWVTLGHPCQLPFECSGSELLRPPTGNSEFYLEGRLKKPSAFQLGWRFTYLLEVAAEILKLSLCMHVSAVDYQSRRLIM